VVGASAGNPSGAGLTVAAVSEPLEARGAAAANVVQVPVDLVEFEARLLALERRLREQDSRDELLMDVAKALRRLTDALGPMLEIVGPLAESRDAMPHAPPAPMSRRPLSPPRPVLSVTASPASGGRPVEPERLAAAQARLREAATEASQPPLASEAAQPFLAPPAMPPRLASLARAPAAGRRSWLVRALRRMVAQDPDSAGRLLVAMAPANRLAQIGPVPPLPGPPATVARVVVKGRLRRRLGWEMAQLDCELSTVSALAKLVRLRASPAQLHAAGVMLDSQTALALVASAIDPRWTLGHRFTIAHLDAGAACLDVRNGRRLAVRHGAAASSAQTTVRCSADALLPLLAGAPGVAAAVEGERRPLELVQGWFQDATGA
jgi:hypothetical protein